MNPPGAFEDRESLVGCVAEALHRLKHPFYFEAESFCGPDSFVDTWLRTGQDELRSEMHKAKAYCDSLGVRFVQLGSISLAVIVFAEALSDEGTIGRSVVILKSVAPFAKFGLRRGLLIPFHVNVFYIFSSSNRAFAFRTGAQGNCKHTKVTFSSSIHIKPWCIDFQGKQVAASKALLSGLDKEPSEIESKLFGSV
jgi:hypothetical protein